MSAPPNRVIRTLRRASSFTRAFFDGLLGHVPSNTGRDPAPLPDSEAAPVAAAGVKRALSVEPVSPEPISSKRRRTSTSANNNNIAPVIPSLPAPPPPSLHPLKRVHSLPPRLSPAAPLDLEHAQESRWKNNLAQARSHLRKSARSSKSVPGTRSSTLPGISHGPDMDRFFEELRSVRLRHVPHSPAHIEQRRASASSLPDVGVGRRRTTSGFVGESPQVRPQPRRASVAGSMRSTPTQGRGSVPLSGLSAPLPMVSSQVKQESVSPEPIFDQPQPTMELDPTSGSSPQTEQQQPAAETATPAQPTTNASSAQSSPLSSPDPPSVNGTPASRADGLRKQLQDVSAGKSIKKPVPPSRLARAKRAAAEGCNEGSWKEASEAEPEASG